MHRHLIQGNESRYIFIYILKRDNNNCVFVYVMHGPALDLEVATFQPLNSTEGKQNTAYYYSVYKKLPIWYFLLQKQLALLLPLPTHSHLLLGCHNRQCLLCPVDVTCGGGGAAAARVSLTLD